jgi:hypothetical protein
MLNSSIKLGFIGSRHEKKLVYDPHTLCELGFYSPPQIENSLEQSANSGHVLAIEPSPIFGVLDENKKGKNGGTIIKLVATAINF